MTPGCTEYITTASRGIALCQLFHSGLTGKGGKKNGLREREPEGRSSRHIFDALLMALLLCLHLIRAALNHVPISCWAIKVAFWGGCLFLVGFISVVADAF